MKIEELRGLAKQELQAKLEDLNKQLMELQFKRRSGVEKPHLFKVVKKDIARIFTVLNEKQGADSEKR
ncbi:MAG: 50S ribosomal protein L29 [Candidatus Omnitrophica bacterium]|nr:50S ribosomal protein L29 [Candidatus Omnitrophota bacterium]